MKREDLKEIISEVITRLESDAPATACGVLWADKAQPTTKYSIGEEDPTTKYSIGEEDVTTRYSIKEEA